MDCPVSAQYQPALSCFSVQNQHLILRYLAGLAARQYADTTLSAVVTTLNTLIRHLPGRRNVVLTDDITQTTAQDISMFITAAQSSGLMPSTINTKLSILTSFFEYLREEGQMTQQPVLRRRHRLLTPTVLPKPMPDTDLAAFFTAIDAVRDRLIFLVMLRCGLRVSEVCALSWDAIDLPAGTVRITRGKGQVDRIVYLSPDVTQALQVWRDHHTPGRYLFPSRMRTKGHLSRYQINVLMAQYLVAAGVARHYSPHCLRHTFATQLLNAGVPLEVLKELMGHHSIQITLRYTQLYDATKRRQYEQAMTKIAQRQATSGRLA
jgi:integrase/recombinase XerD